MEFCQPIKGVEEIFQLIARTAIGREVLESFLPHYHSRRIVIEFYPLSVIERLREALGPGQPIGACFVTDGVNGTIYMDPAGVLGIAAPFLLHEMVHSLDSSIWKSAHLPLSPDAKDELFLGAESKAFNYQHRFVEELTQRFPEYKAFLVTQHERVRILHERLTTTDIADLYGFKIPKAS